MKTVDDLEVSGKRVLVRADLNVPLAGSRITMPPGTWCKQRLPHWSG